MAKEVDLYPGVVYETVNGYKYVVADQSPSNPDGKEQGENEKPWWTTYAVRPDDNPWKLNPILRGTDHPDVIVRLRQPLSRDEMASLIDVSNFPVAAQEKFRNKMVEEIDTNLARPARRIVAPNLEE